MVEKEIATLNNFMNNPELQSSTNVQELAHVIKSADAIIRAFRNNQIGHIGGATLAFKVKAQLFDNFINIGKVPADERNLASLEEAGISLENDIEILKGYFRAPEKGRFGDYEFVGTPTKEEVLQIYKCTDNIIASYRKGKINDTQRITLAFKAKAYIFDTYMYIYKKSTVKNNIRGKIHMEYVPLEYHIPEGTVTEHAKKVLEENYNVCKTHTTTFYHDIDKIITPLSDILITNPTVYHDSYSDIKKIENMLANTYSEYAIRNIQNKITVMIYNEFNVNSKNRTYNDINNDTVLKSYQRKNIFYRINASQRKKIVEAIVDTPPLTMAADAAYDRHTGPSYGQEHAFYPEGRKVPKHKSMDEYDLDGRNTRANGIRFIEDGRQY